MITTESEWREAVSEVKALWDAQPGTPEHDRLEELGWAVSEYEDRTFKAALKIITKQTSKSRAYLAKNGD
jgi:antitoxin component HigA of HigAB toxin-antitoxin module